VFPDLSPKPKRYYILFVSPGLEIFRRDFVFSSGPDSPTKILLARFSWLFLVQGTTPPHLLFFLGFLVHLSFSLPPWKLKRLNNPLFRRSPLYPFFSASPLGSVSRKRAFFFFVGLFGSSLRVFFSIPFLSPLTLRPQKTDSLRVWTWILFSLFFFLK